MTKEDVRRLLGMNHLDRLIWDEARKLHALDVVSLRQMQLHSGMDKDSGNKEEVEEEEDVDEDGEETIKSCCGNVCHTAENPTNPTHLSRPLGKRAKQGKTGQNRAKQGKTQKKAL